MLPRKQNREKVTIKIFCELFVLDSDEKMLMGFEVSFFHEMIVGAEERKEKKEGVCEKKILRKKS